jgi:hypothetical protein
MVKEKLPVAMKNPESSPAPPPKLHMFRPNGSGLAVNWGEPLPPVAVSGTVYVEPNTPSGRDVGVKSNTSNTVILLRSNPLAV